MIAITLRKLRWPILLLALAFCQGCTTWEFDITQPPELARHIGTDKVTEVHAAPFDFGFRAVEGRLVMWINNTTTEPIELLGSKSFAVDPSGQSHPLADQTIASASFVKLILPPIPPRLEPRGPIIGIGASFGRADGPGYIRPGGYGYTEHMDIDTSGNPYYWDWDGQTTVHLTIVYQRRDTTGQVAFAFHRVKK